MADFDLVALAIAQGITFNRPLPGIDPTQSLEDDLYAIIYPIVSAYRQQIAYMQDQWDTAYLTRHVVDALLLNATHAGERQLTIMEPKLDNWSARVEQWQRTRWSGVVKSNMRLDITPLLNQGDVRALVEAQTKINVAYITKMEGDMQARVEAAVWKAYAQGSTARNLGKVLRDELDFAPARARTIARDQLGKYSGALDRARHEQAGLNLYKWETSHDDRVRPTHRENAVTDIGHGPGVFAYGTPPPSGTGEPGQDILCRCKGLAIVLTDEEEAQLAAEGLGVGAL